MLDLTQNSKRLGLTGPPCMDACHWLATVPQRASRTTLPADAERVFGDFAPRERRPASPRTGAGPDGRAGSTALCSAARVPPACAAGIMRSTRAHGAGIAGHSRDSAKSPELLKVRGHIPLKFTHPANRCARNGFLDTKSRTSGPYSH